MSKVLHLGVFEQCELRFTTDGSGNATVISTDKYIGYVEAVQLIDGTVDDGVDITLTSEQGELSIPILSKVDWNTDQMVYPRAVQALNSDGTALTSHTRPITSGEIKAVIAQGGATKSGGLIVYVAKQ